MTSRSSSREDRRPSTAQAGDRGPSWTFLSNHGHVLLSLATNAEVTVRAIALRVGITERAVHNILGELEQAGYITRSKEGRRNVYAIHAELPLRHPVEAHRSVGDLIGAVLEG